jgi:hypothetical protein
MIIDKLIKNRFLVRLEIEDAKDEQNPDKLSVTIVGYDRESQTHAFLANLGLVLEGLAEYGAEELIEVDAGDDCNDLITDFGNLKEEDWYTALLNDIEMGWDLEIEEGMPMYEKADGFEAWWKDFKEEGIFLDPEPYRDMFAGCWDSAKADNQ